MFCKESPSLQTLSAAKSLSSLFPKPSALINPILTVRQDKRCRRRRCKITALQSNIAHKGKLTNEKVQKIKVKGSITAEEGTLLENLSWSRPLDVITDIRGRSLLVELISTETDTRTLMEKEPVADYAQRVWFESRNEKYECVFDMPEDFGTVGAIRVQNQHHREMFIKEMVLELPSGSVTFSCNSWVTPKSVDPTKRIFFSNKSYL